MEIANEIYENDSRKRSASTHFISRWRDDIVNENFAPAYGNPYDTFASELQERFPEVWESGGGEALRPFLSSS